MPLLQSIEDKVFATQVKLLKENVAELTDAIKTLTVELKTLKAQVDG